MKNKIYKICFMLIVVLSAMNVQGEVIVGISDPFVFGSTGVALPLSPVALIIAAGLIGLFISWRYLRSRKNETV